MAVTQTAKCPTCDFENDPSVKNCASPTCGAYLKPEVECLRSIDFTLSEELATLRILAIAANTNLKVIRRVAIWFLVMSILGLLLGLMAATGAFR